MGCGLLVLPRSFGCNASAPPSLYRSTQMMSVVVPTPNVRATSASGTPASVTSFTNRSLNSYG